MFTIPGTQSQQASDILQQRFPAANGSTAQVVFHAPSGTVTGPAQVTAITATVANLAKVPGALVATNPTQPLFASNVSPDQTTSYSTVTFPADLTALPDSTMDALRRATDPAVQAGLTVQFGGAVVDHLNQPTSSISEHADDIGLAIAVIILLVALGSVVSMAVPISLALMALLCSSLLLEIVAAHRTVGTVSPILGTMIGLGVGIDYSLFIVSRHRQNLAAGMDTETAAGRALATSGSAVLFAAVAVCLALGGLALIRIPYLTTLGLSAAMYVAVTVAAALTLLPAMLGLFGPHIDALSIHHRNEADRRRDPLGPLGAPGRPAPAAVLPGEPHHPAGPRRAPPAHPPGPAHRLERADLDHPAPGLRRAVRPLRPRRERAPAGRRPPDRAGLATGGAGRL